MGTLHKILDTTYKVRLHGDKKLKKYEKISKTKAHMFFWAKKNDKNGQYEWLSLIQHLRDTSDVSGLLWEHWLSQGQRQLVADIFKNGNMDQAKNLVQFLGAIHDLGKATPAFQTKKSSILSSDLDYLLINKLELAGFRDIINLDLASVSKTPHALAGHFLMSQFGFKDDIASIVGAHHGKPVATEQLVKSQIAYKSNYYQYDLLDHQIGLAWAQSQETIIKWALNENEFSSYEELPEIPQPVQVLLSGLLIMADWIASNETYFPLIPIDQSQVVNQSQRLTRGWNLWCKTRLWESCTYGSIEEQYIKRFGFSPNEVQQKFAQLIEQTKDPGILILEAPMGIGKTEAALLGSELLAEKTKRSGLFFGLPTQATSNGIFPRIKRWLNHVNDEDLGKVSLRLAHGKAALNSEFRELSQNINIDGEFGASVIANEWFAGRKTSSLDDFVVGTVDQFLLVALKQKHLALRHLGFSKKVVIIDEVHAYDAYMNQYLCKAIQWIATYGVPIIILSATLPKKRREAMIHNYLRGKGVRSRDIESQLSNMSPMDYPLITYTDGVSVRQRFDFSKSDPKTVQIIRESTENIMEVLDGWSNQEGVIGIIVNTVGRAQEIAKDCSHRYGEDSVFVLHSNYISAHRAQKEVELLSMIGKNAERPKYKIIIGTQVIEQSLDIDFDVLVSDLAPIDLLIQRIGRLHRHPIKRPEAHRYPKVYVLGTDEKLNFESGSNAVYGGYLLARTQAFLPNTINLPCDISSLVQSVYGEQEIDWSQEVIESYKKMKQDHQLLLKEKELKANVYRIADPQLIKSRKKSNSIIGWLHNSTPHDTEEHVYAQVRDTQETIEVIALKKKGSGYGIFDEEIDLSDQLEISDVSKRIASQTLRLPNQLSAPYRIDSTIRVLEKMNNKYFKRWLDQPWLKGELGLLFDEDNQAKLNGFILQYDDRYGLVCERM